MAATTNKGYAIITTGSESGTWGDTLNSDVFEIIDNNLGGIVTKSVAGSNITFTSDEAQNCIIRLTGAQSADVQVTNPCIGFYFVENLTTNTFNITVTNGVSGVVVPKGRSTVIADATNGCRIAGTDGFPPGTKMTFNQTLAPTGWTKSTVVDDAGFRLTSGVVGSAGSVAFTTAFASQPVTGTNSGTAITISQMPLHGHPFRLALQNSADSNTSGGFMLNDGGNSDFSAYTGALGIDPGHQISGTGGGQSHTHTFTGTAINLAVKYVDLIIAVKN